MCVCDDDVQETHERKWRSSMGLREEAADKMKKKFKSA